MILSAKRLLLPMAFTLAACGGGGGNSTPQPQEPVVEDPPPAVINDDVSPEISISFPHQNPVKIDSTRFRLAGYATDNEEVAEIEVNGIGGFPIDEDGYWVAEINLTDFRRNTVKAVAVDISGNVSEPVELEVDVTTETELDWCGGVAAHNGLLYTPHAGFTIDYASASANFLPANQQLKFDSFVHSPIENALYGMVKHTLYRHDLTTGQINEIDTLSTFDGSVIEMAFDESGKNLYFGSAAAIWVYPLESGTLQRLSTESSAGSPLLSGQYADVWFHSGQLYWLVGDSGNFDRPESSEVYQVDLTTGERTKLYTHHYAALAQLVVDETYFYFVGARSNTGFAVDRNSQEIAFSFSEILRNFQVYSLDNPTLDKDSLTGNLYLAQCYEEFIVELAIDQGIVTGTTRFGDANSGLIEDMAYVSAADTIYLAYGNDHLYAVDPDSGSKREVKVNDRDALLGWQGGNIVPAGNQNALYFSNDNYISYVGLDDGVRREINSPESSGHSLAYGEVYMGLSQEFNGRLIGIIDKSDDIDLVSIDTSTGHSLLISSPEDGMGTGPSPYTVWGAGIGINETENLAYISIDEQILSVDLASGDRAVLSSNDDGLQPEISTIGKLLWVPEIQKLYALGDSGGYYRLISIDPESGEREIVDTAGANLKSRIDGLTWDSERELVYLYTGRVIAMDPKSGATVLLTAEL
ncbi:hypothetical protein KUV22_07925 [Microbulbifer agarilyticus]|uniref:hypothetical protein n=1 Tax=Microbulbifer agarilyticus TaxID=260552 RepID=UPI001C95AF3D|nr:hypothetical protein [Microbulbifer agarilyticus]MBY6190346.1 hypothetical protein [Microbulbifer agarilyticus]